MKCSGLKIMFATGAVVTALVVASPSTASAEDGQIETAGGDAATWTDPTTSGGEAGPTIPALSSVVVSCKFAGLSVGNGNNNWYRVATPPWNNHYYVSADAFYNDGSTQGTLAGTPWVDPAVPNCSDSDNGEQGTEESCASVQGELIPGDGTISPWLYAHFVEGTGSQVVVPWSYFANDPEFVAYAKSLPVRRTVDTDNIWRAKNPTDMYYALGSFTVLRTSSNCYYIYDYYDFDKAKELPAWLQQQLSDANAYSIQAAGKL